MVAGDAETHAEMPGTGEPSGAAATTAGAPPSSAAAAGERAGESIGPYRLVSRLGEGGFGVVWLAERREPFVQQVAVKIIKPGMDSREVIARFEMERQALAMMDHPSIARVIDGGVTPPSMGLRPYFVMEYVRGRPITAHCDAARLGLRDRLELFIRVCEAVQHAHAKGLIHRDLKPSNILVGDADADGASPPASSRQAVVKVIDFGVAKAMDRPITAGDISTRHGALLGTPEYMSPEQAAPGGADIDTRTDVYALGVVLYELLVGSRPFEAGEARGLEALRRAIREEAPPPPRARLSRLDPRAAADIAARRATDPASLRRRLGAELEWIPLKALRKDPARRYAGAGYLADDLRRYLDGWAVEAAPESAAYRARKLAARHRGPALALAAVAAALVLGAAGFAWQARLAAAERDATRLQRDRARAVTDLLVQSLRAQDPAKRGRPDITVAEAMSEMAARLERGELRDQPATEGVLLRTMADILTSNGRAAEAAPLAERAVALLRRAAAGRDDPELAEALDRLANVRETLGRAADAEPLYAESLAMRRRLFDGDSSSVAASLNNLAGVRESLGRGAEAEPLYLEALRMHERMHPDGGPRVAASLNNLAYLRESLGRDAEAAPLYERALEMYRREHPGDHPDVATAMNNLAKSRLNAGRDAEAEALFTESLDMTRRLYKGDHPDVAIGLNNLAHTLARLGHRDRAAPLFTEAIEMNQRLFPGDHPVKAATLANYARFLAPEEPTRALATAEEARDMAARLLPPDSPARRRCEDALAEVRAAQPPR